ncbi:hypothetical protein ACQKFO_21545 [Rossellomorea sp. NPDC071047]
MKKEKSVEEKNSEKLMLKALGVIVILIIWSLPILNPGLFNKIFQ